MQKTFFQINCNICQGKKPFSYFNLSWKIISLFNIAKKEENSVKKKMILARFNVNKYEYMQSYKNKSENINTLNIHITW